MLGVLGVVSSIYLFGYLGPMEEKRTAGVFGFFYNLTLLSLTVVFTASNAFFFLIALEAMALTAYCLITFEHRKEITRQAGVLFFTMPHAGAECLTIGFLLLNSVADSLDFSSFAATTTQLAVSTHAAGSLLFL